MITLQDDARVWYEWLPPASICSLEDFYSALCERYETYHYSSEMVENLCGSMAKLLLYLGIGVDGEDLLDWEIRETLLKING